MNLFELLKTGSLKEIKSVINVEPTLAKSKDENKKTTVFYAIEQNNINLFNYLISKKASVKGTDHDKNTALHHAVKANNPEMITILIEKKVKIDQINKKQLPPVELIDSTTKPEVIQALINGGLDIDQSYPIPHTNPSVPKKRKDISSPLIAAIKAQNLEALKVMLKQKPDLNAIFEYDNPDYDFKSRHHLSFYPFFHGTVDNRGILS